MANYPYILFNKSPEQLRRQGAHGGRTFGRNHKARMARMTSPPQPAAPPCRYGRPRLKPWLASTLSFVGCGVRKSELPRSGPNVTRARITHIMKLLHLAPDIQERILFPPLIPGLNERNLRPLFRPVDWNEQRLLFQKIMERLEKAGDPVRDADAAAWING